MGMGRPFAWPDSIQGAVSLTYDDGLPVHYTRVAPLLQQHGLFATFYPMVQSDLRLHPENWRQLAAAGHELGNHTLFHPCRQRSPDPFPWLDRRYDLKQYTPAHLRAELEVANLVLSLLDGRQERTYAYTCCDATIGSGATEQPLEPLLADLFIAARGELMNKIVHPKDGINLFNIGCIHIDGLSLEELIRLVEQARTSSGWAVLMMHGVGADTHDLYLDAEVHKRFIGWLARQQGIWTAPVRTIVHYIKQC